MQNVLIMLNLIVSCKVFSKGGKGVVMFIVLEESDAFVVEIEECRVDGCVQSHFSREESEYWIRDGHAVENLGVDE